MRYNTEDTAECEMGDSGLIPEAASIVIFGATGDLAMRKIYPALYNLASDGILPTGTRIIGFARREWNDDDFRLAFIESCRTFSRLQPSRSRTGENTLSSLSRSVSYIKGDLSDSKAYSRLAISLSLSGMPTNVLFYLAVGPDLFTIISEQLAQVGLGTMPDRRFNAVSSDGGAGLRINGIPDDTVRGSGQGERRLIVEKPFGRDRESSRALTRHLQERFREKDIYRIDHYLGKETVQNLLYLRFANAIFEPLWNRNHIASIDIDVFETSGIGSRGGYYDKAGAARDMLQNHLVQLLCLIAMEPPSSLDPEAIRDEKVKVLKAIPDYSPREISGRSVRGQYVVRGTDIKMETESGLAEGNGSVVMKSYRAEDKVASDSMTETFAGMRIELDNWRFSGVPIRLRTGKALNHVSSEIVVRFKRPPATLFAAHCGDRLASNRLTVRIQPDDGVWLSFNGKVPGASRIQHQELGFSNGSGKEQVPEAYERLIADALSGDSTLFIRSDESDEAWRIVDVLEKAWAENPEIPLILYPAGSEPPELPDKQKRSEINSGSSEMQ